MSGVTRTPTPQADLLDLTFEETGLQQSCSQTKGRPLELWGTDS